MLYEEKSLYALVQHVVDGENSVCVCYTVINGTVEIIVENTRISTARLQLSTFGTTNQMSI